MIYKFGKKKGKRYIALLAFLVVLFMASLSRAELNRFSQGQEIQMYIIQNTSGTAYLQTNVSTSTITTANHRILGAVVVPYDETKNAELVVGLYDVAALSTVTSSNYASYVFDEIEMGTTENRQPRWYPYPKRLTTQLSIWQGPNTVVIIFYEDLRKF